MDIKRVISGSTSDVQISELSKKGFKQVKVLNQAVIVRLIGEAVDLVMKKRSQKMTADERTKVIQESTGKFEALAQEKIQRERNRISELEKANEALLKETEDLRIQIDRFRSAPAPAPALNHEGLMEALVGRLQGMAGPGANIDKLEKSMQMIADRIDRLPKGQGGAEYVDKDVIIDALFRHDIGTDTESNIDRVKVKEEKAGGVKDTLAKLKALQKKE